MGLIDQATNSVNLSYQGSLDALDAQAAKTQAEYAQRQAAIASMYGGLGSQLGTVGTDYAAAAPAIADGYLANLGSVAGLFGGTTGMMPGAEAQAGNMLGSSMGQATMGLLAEGSQRNLNYNSSAVRQSGIDSTNTQKALAMDLQQFLDNVALQRTQIEREKAMAIQAELDRLRQQRFQNTMTRKQFRLQRRSANQQYRMNQFQLQRARQAAAGGGGGGGGTTSSTTTVPSSQVPIDKASIDKLLSDWRSSHPAGLAGAGVTYFTQSIAQELRAEGAPESYILRVKNYIDQAWAAAGGAPRQTPIIQGPRI